MSKYNIAYFYFHDSDYEFNPMYPSHLVESSFIGNIKYFPKNLFQIIKSYSYFKTFVDLSLKHPYSIYVYKELPLEFNPEHLIGVVFWNKSQPIPDNLKEIINFPVIIFNYNEGEDKRSILEIVDSVINKICDTAIEKLPKNEKIRKSFILHKKHKSKSKNFHIPNFNPSNSNHLNITQINGTFGTKLKIDTVEDLTQRRNILLNSVKKLDDIHLLTLIKSKEELKIEDNYTHYKYPTLILASPWINPNIFKFKNIKKLADKLNVTYDQAKLINTTFNLEQNNVTYAYGIEDISFFKNKDEENIRLFFYIKDIINRRIASLDAITFLHSSLLYSPSYRLPLISRDLDKLLSWFSPDEVDRRINNKLHFSKLQEIGIELGEKFSDTFFEYINKRNGPLLIISDLPYELASHNNVPLFYSHDICRIPETTLESNLSEYFKNSFIPFNMSVDLLNKTLVACTCPSDPNILMHFNIIKNHINKMDDGKSVRFEIYSSCEDLSNAIKEFKPELLILDTHGFNRKDKLDSGIIIGEEQVSASEIVKYQISAPIVILSSCYTAPVFGYVDIIAHGFFEAGAYSVLSTILPIANTGANILYSRVLTNLIYALKENMHDNWSSFISHNIRTSLIDDYIQLVSIRLKSNDWMDFVKFQKHRVIWQNESFMFETREKSFHDIPKTILDITKDSEKFNVEKILNSLDGFVPDAYAYTLLGRADLIKMPAKIKVIDNFIAENIKEKE